MIAEENLPADTVQVHKKVLEEIVYNAVKDVRGVNPSRRGVWPRIVNALTGNRFPGVRVKVGGQSGVEVFLNLYVRYGLHIPEVARQAQEIVRAALEKATDVQIKGINVNVQGVIRED